MVKKIKGITIELGAETTQLDKALGDINKRSKDLTTELKSVERLLKFDPSNVEGLAQKQELLTRQIENTTTKLEALKQAEQQVQEKFRQGKISEEQYRNFRREIEFTAGQLNQYQQELSDVRQEQAKILQSTRQLETLFEATGRSVDDFADSLGNRLTNAIRNGTASSRDLDRAIERIGREALGADADIDRMRRSLASIDDGNSIQNIRRDFQRLQEDVEASEQSIKDVGLELENIAGALVAGGGIAGAVEQALDMSSLNTKIDITFDASEESKQNIKEAVIGIQAYGLDGEEALEGVRRQWTLNKDASDATNTTVARGAATIAKNFSGIDFTELIQETNEIGSALKISNVDALALVDTLLKAGFPPEQIDTIAEYGTQMQSVGFSAAEIQAIFEAGIDTKTWNIDNLNDGVKEARLTMAGFGAEVDKNMSGLLSKAGMSSEQFQTWGKAVAKGGEDGSKAMSEMVTWLDGIQDKTLRNELATKVFGTKWEDQGENMIAVFQGVGEAADKTDENMNSLYETMGKTNADPMVELQQAITNVKLAAEPLLLTIANIISKVATWVAENPKLAATITAIVTGIGILIGILMALAPIFTTLTTLAGLLGLSVGALVGIIAGVVVAIGLLIAAGIYLYKNWDEIKAKAIEIWGAIKNWMLQTWQSIKQKTQEIWSSLKSWLSNLWASTKNLASEKFQQLVSAVQEKMSSARSKISEIWSNIKTFFSTTISNIVSTVRTKFSDIVNSIREKMNSAREIVSGIVEKIKGFFNINLYASGKAIIQSAIDGLMSMKDKILGKVEGIVGAVRDFWPFSPAKRGPLSDINKMDFAGPIGDSIQSAENPLTRAMNQLAGRVMNSASQMTAVRQSDIANSQNVNKVQSNQSIVIQPAPVILNGEVIATVTFPYIDAQFSNNSQIASYMRGSKT